MSSTIRTLAALGLLAGIAWFAMSCPDRDLDRAIGIEPARRSSESGIEAVGGLHAVVPPALGEVHPGSVPRVEAASSGSGGTAAIGGTSGVDPSSQRVARGRVTSQGEPVAEARVWLEHPAREEAGRDLAVALDPGSRRLRARASREVRTDAEGRFELPLDADLTGVFDVVARRLPLTDARLRSVGVDRRPDLNGLELVLGPGGGAIHGVVRTPPDRSPLEVWIEFSHVAESFHTGVDEHGRFGVEALSPGRWSLAVHQRLRGAREDSGVGSRRTWSHGPPTDPPSWRAFDTPFFADLPAGESVEVELDLRRRPACLLEGLFLLDGRPLEPLRETDTLGWFEPRRRRAFLEREGDPGFRARVPLAADGRFLLAVEQAGLYRLRIEVPFAPGSELVVVDQVDLRPGSSTWTLDLPTGRVALRPQPHAALATHELLHRWRGPGERRVITQHPFRASMQQPTIEDAEGTELLFPYVPAGPGEILLDSRAGPPTHLADVDVLPWGETLLELP